MDKKKFWEEIYSQVPSVYEKLNKIPGVLSVFNSNIDAIVKTTPERFLKWCSSFNIESADQLPPSSIASPKDLLEGFLHSFSKGFAQELLISDESLFQEIHDTIGYDHLQMGGQGGIIGNVMSAAGVQNVLVHTASLPKEQSGLFLKNKNLLSALSDGSVKPAFEIERAEDIPLIHWILEFSKGDEIHFGGKKYTCPKSNRFIATWDPLNFRLTIDPGFVKAVEQFKTPLSYCLLSGYQMLTEPLADGKSSLSRIQESKETVDRWRKQNPDMTVHFEFACTSDKTVRRFLFDEMSPWADSIGLNEQELIDLLEVIGEEDLAAECRDNLDPAALTSALIVLFKQCRTKRIQIHFYGLFIIIRNPDSQLPAESALCGMALAATAAASKAATGAIDTEESLLYAQNMPVKGAALDAFNSVAEYLERDYKADTFKDTGIFSTEEFELIALPTILVDNPITLVGMGDTISSLSLVAAQK